VGGCDTPPALPNRSKVGPEKCILDNQFGPRFGPRTADILDRYVYIIKIKVFHRFLSYLYINITAFVNKIASFKGKQRILKFDRHFPGAKCFETDLTLSFNNVSYV
jgi:hypothetical protein